MPQTTGLPELCPSSHKGAVPVVPSPTRVPSAPPAPQEKSMAYEKSVDISDINRAMFKCPWLEYPGRTKGEVRMDRSGVGDRDLEKKAPWPPVPGRSLGDVSKSMGRARVDPWVLPRLRTPLKVSSHGPLRRDVSVTPSSCFLICSALSQLQGFKELLLPTVLPLVCLAASPTCIEDSACG